MAGGQRAHMKLASLPASDKLGSNPAPRSTKKENKQTTRLPNSPTYTLQGVERSLRHSRRNYRWYPIKIVLNSRDSLRYIRGNLNQPPYLFILIGILVRDGPNLANMVNVP